MKSALEIVRDIRDGRTTAVRVVEEHIARIERMNPRLNAIVRFDFERALSDARERDRQRRAGSSALGVLHGVPFTLKDMHVTKGLGASLGSRATESIGEDDGVVARRLRQAGAILLGKTNMGLSVQTLSEQFGRSVNPHDPERTTGGSSGGAAAAVASGLSAFDIGTDLSGSIRMPAHFCGTFGLRATPNRVPIADVVGGRVDRRTESLGPIARTAADCAAIFSVLVGPDPSDPEVIPLLPGSRGVPVDIRSLRVAFAAEIPGIRIEGRISRAIERLANDLGRAGARVIEGVPFDFEELLGAFRRYMRFAMSLLVNTGVAPPPGAAAMFAPPSAGEIAAAIGERERHIQRAEAFFTKYDVFLSPAATCTAFTHRERGAPVEIDGVSEPSTSIDHPTIWSTLTGCPSFVVPIGPPESLPIGAQLVGRRWTDERLMATGGAIASIASGRHADADQPQPPLKGEIRNATTYDLG